MRKLYSFVFCGLVSINSYAAELGLGLSIKSGEEELFIPYQLNDSIRIEGLVNLSHTHNNSSSSSTTSSYSDYYLIGVGVFTTRKSSENSAYYLGGRVAIMSSETGTSSGSTNSETDNKGYLLSPVVGYEYFISQNFSLGADVAYSYVHWDADSSAGTSNSDSKYINKEFTKTFIVRYYF